MPQLLDRSLHLTARTGDEEVSSVRGWGRADRSLARVARPRAAEELAAALRAAGPGGVLARGAGRSYGDAALCDGGTVVDLTGAGHLLSFDHEAGVVVAEAGATLAAVMARTVPTGWVLPVMPGTLQVTVGGAVAADVHGKNHVSAGSFARHLDWIDVMDADGRVNRLVPHEADDWFWATCGGMGLTGVVLRAAIRLRPGGGSVLRRQERAGSFDEVMDLMDAAVAVQRRNSHLHAIAWVDAAGHGRAFGRGVVETVYLLRHGAGPGAATGRPREVPSLPGPGVMTPWVVRALNALRWRTAGRPEWDVRPLTTTLQPLDRLDVWPAAFGRAGLQQCQIALPDEHRSVLGEVLHRLRALHLPPALVTVKRLGAGTPGPLSFPIEGWTLAMDFPAAQPGLATALTWVEDLTVRAGGRAYLAKDSRLGPAALEAMYPDLPRWRRVRDAMDPEGAFASDLGRRLGLVPAAAR